GEEKAGISTLVDRYEQAFDLVRDKCSKDVSSDECQRATSDFWDILIELRVVADESDLGGGFNQNIRHAYDIVEEVIDEVAVLNLQYQKKLIEAVQSLSDKTLDELGKIELRK